MESSELSNDNEFDKDILQSLVQKALWKAGAFVQFKELSNRNLAKLDDWLDSDKVRIAPTADDIGLQDAISHMENLKSNIVSWNFEIIPVPGDGNCFFHAIRCSIETLVKIHPGLASIDPFRQYLKSSDNSRIHFLRKLLVIVHSSIIFNPLCLITYF